MEKLFEKNFFLEKIYKFWINYFSPGNFSYLWNFGSMALICLILQIITGLFLAMHYKSDLSLAFSSIEYICRNVQYGWVMRYLHANGASVFFIVVYLHILRGFMYSSFSYPRQLLWGTGVIILILMIATAFLGYVLPWGQMSFWAATVITSLFSAIPLIGNEIVLWLWGGYSVDNATLNRFFCLHFFFPFVILAVSIIHLMLLHEFGSNNPIGAYFRSDGTPIAPYYIVKDVYGTNYLFILIVFLVFFVPNLLGHPDNYILGNPLVTPTHIVPEWYFLPFYAVLRSIPNKLFGVIALACAILIILFLPFVIGNVYLIRSINFKPLLKILIVILIFNTFILGWIGGQPVIPPFYFIGQISTVMYFLIFGFFYCIGFFEQGLYLFFKILPNKIL